MTIETWLEKWYQLHALRVRPSTLRGYRAALAHLPPNFAGMEIDQVTPMDWATAFASISAVYPRQAQLAHVALRAALTDARKYKAALLLDPPWLYAEPPRHDTRQIAYLLPDEIPAYARAAAQTPAALPLLLMLCLGLRRGEALGLRWADVDTRRQLITVRQQLINGEPAPLKTKSSYRSLPLDATIIGILYKWGDSDNELLYNGGVRRLYASHTSALDAAGIDAPITLHGLRHSAATAALAAGASLKCVSAILGHAHVAITADTYCHALMTEERAALSAISSQIAGPSGPPPVTRLEIA